MSFNGDIKYLMTNDPSLNSYCEGIKFEYLPDGFDITKNWILYSFSKISQKEYIDCISPVIKYLVSAKVITNDTNTLEIISDRLVNYLNRNEYNNIKRIQFISDEHGIDLKLNLFSNVLQFETTYINE